MTGATADPEAPWDGAGEAGSPALTLDGFSGPLDHLLALARAQRVDISRISVAAQLVHIGRGVLLGGRLCR